MNNPMLALLAPFPVSPADDKYSQEALYSEAAQVFVDDPESFETLLNWFHDPRLDIVARLEYLKQRALEQAHENLIEQAEEKEWIGI